MYIFSLPRKIKESTTFTFRVKFGISIAFSHQIKKYKDIRLLFQVTVVVKLLQVCLIPKHNI